MVMIKNWSLEKIICAILTIGFLIFLFPSYVAINRDQQNNTRISDLSQIKGALERYNNKTGYFPPLDDSLNLNNHCATARGSTKVSLDPTSEYSPLLFSRNNKINNLYCATNIKTFTNKTQKTISANGFYLETNLTGTGKNSSGFDDTAGHNFRYKQYTDNGILKYRICGGDEKSCGDMPQ